MQGLLHLWVMIVLLTYQPEIHGNMAVPHETQWRVVYLSQGHIPHSWPMHRRMSQGVVGACSPPPVSGKTVIFWAKAKFFGQKPAAKNETKKKRNSFFLARKSARNPGFSLIITPWGESGKVILQVSIAILSGAVKKFFRQILLSPPRKNWPVCLWTCVSTDHVTWHCMAAVTVPITGPLPYQLVLSYNRNDCSDTDWASTPWAIKTCHFISVYSICVSWGIFALLVPMKTGMNSIEYSTIYLHWCS